MTSPLRLTQLSTALNTSAAEVARLRVALAAATHKADSLLTALPNAPTIAAQATPEAPDLFAIREYLSHLEVLYNLDDPYETAVKAWKSFRLFPISFARSETKWEAEPQPRSLIDVYFDHAALSRVSAQKTREWAYIIPGNDSTYIYNGREEAYIDGYREAWKAHTWKKRGVDCNRHVEIVASGAIPIFRNIQYVPEATMFAYPKHLMAFFEKHKRETLPAKLHVWRHLMLKWGHKHLTAAAMAQYMAKVTGVDLSSPLSTTRRVAYINDKLPFEADYQANSILIGLIEWLGYERVDVFYFPNYLIEGNKRETSDGRVIYGDGFGYANVLKRPTGPFRQLDDMIKSLEMGEYAAVVWGNWRRSNIHFADKALAAYINRPEALWVCDGEDYYSGWPFSKGAELIFGAASIFVRELHSLTPDKITLPSRFFALSTTSSSMNSKLHLPFPEESDVTKLIVLEGGPTRLCVENIHEASKATFQCPGLGVVVNVTFASFGTSVGTCVSGFSLGQCHAPRSSFAIYSACEGLNSCTVDVSAETFMDPCEGVAKHLNVQVACSGTSVLFKNGAMTPHKVHGITGANIDATANALIITADPGQYHFVLSGW